MHVFNSSLNFTEIQIRFVHLEMISIFVINQIKIKIQFQVSVIVMLMLEIYLVKKQKNILQANSILL